MINYEHLDIWIQITEQIDTLEQMIKNNLDLYFRIKEIKHLEEIQRDISEILKLKPIQEEHPHKTFNKL